MHTTYQPSVYEQTVLTIMRRLPPECALQLVDFARFLEFQTTEKCDDWLGEEEAADKPMAEIKPVVSVSKPLRPFGLCAGEFIVPNGFDDPLPEHIIQEFEG